MLRRFQLRTVILKTLKVPAAGLYGFTALNPAYQDPDRRGRVFATRGYTKRSGKVHYDETMQFTLLFFWLVGATSDVRSLRGVSRSGRVRSRKARAGSQAGMGLSLACDRSWEGTELDRASRLSV